MTKKVLVGGSLGEAAHRVVEAWHRAERGERVAPRDNITFLSWSALGTLSGFVCLVLGGFLVGFGARYAGGCTSGHAISGLANLQLPSLIAVVGFFAGGMLITYFVLPYLV